MYTSFSVFLFNFSLRKSKAVSSLKKKKKYHALIKIKGCGIQKNIFKDFFIKTVTFTDCERLIGSKKRTTAHKDYFLSAHDLSDEEFDEGSFGIQKEHC